MIHALGLADPPSAPTRLAVSPEAALVRSAQPLSTAAGPFWVSMAHGRRMEWEARERSGDHLDSPRLNAPHREPTQAGVSNAEGPPHGELMARASAPARPRRAAPRLALRRRARPFALLATAT